MMLKTCLVCMTFFPAINGVHRLASNEQGIDRSITEGRGCDKKGTSSRIQQMEIWWSKCEIPPIRSKRFARDLLKFLHRNIDFSGTTRIYPIPIGPEIGHFCLKGPDQRLRIALLSITRYSPEAAEEVFQDLRTCGLVVFYDTKNKIFGAYYKTDTSDPGNPLEIMDEDRTLVVKYITDQRDYVSFQKSAYADFAASIGD